MAEQSGKRLRLNPTTDEPVAEAIRGSSEDDRAATDPTGSDPGASTARGRGHRAAHTEPVDFALADRASAYEFIRRTLVQFDYAAPGKTDKSAVKASLAKMTGLSRAQLTRLMAQHRSTRCIHDRRSAGAVAPHHEVLHRGRHPPARRGQHPRPASAAGRPPGRCCAAGTRSSARCALRAPGGAVERAPVPPARLAHLPQPAQRVHPDPSQGRGHRRAAQAPPRRAAWILARRHRPSGRPQRSHGGVLHQHRTEIRKRAGVRNAVQLHEICPFGQISRQL